MIGHGKKIVTLVQLEESITEFPAIRASFYAARGFPQTTHIELNVMNAGDHKMSGAKGKKHPPHPHKKSPGAKNLAQLNFLPSTKLAIGLEVNISTNPVSSDAIKTNLVDFKILQSRFLSMALQTASAVWTYKGWSGSNCRRGHSFVRELQLSEKFTCKENKNTYQQ